MKFGQTKGDDECPEVALRRSPRDFWSRLADDIEADPSLKDGWLWIPREFLREYSRDGWVWGLRGVCS